MSYEKMWELLAFCGMALCGMPAIELAIAIACAFAGGIMPACAIWAFCALAHMLGGGIAMAIGIPVGFATEGMAPGGINGGWPRIH